MRCRKDANYRNLILILACDLVRQMFVFYQKQFPMNDKRIVLTQILNTEEIKNSVEPVILINLSMKHLLKIVK